MKNVLVDFSHLNDFNGFGEIARNYCPRLAKACLPDIHLLMIVPDDKVGAFGNHITYIRRSKKREDLRKLNIHIDLWHATDQQYHLRGGDKKTIQLLTVHDLNFLREKSGIHRLRHIIQLKWRMYRSDYLTTISGYVKKDIEDYYNMGGKPIDVIYNGIGNLEVGDRKKPTFITNDDEQFFFTIGQIREKKNFHTLVPMMHFFPNHKLYICGDDHFAYANELRKVIEEHGEGRVVLAGKISDEEKRWLYEHTEAFLFPSRLEGFGIPVLEAMRFRCKVFSSNLSSLPEVCGKYASYWSDFKPQAMAEVVKHGISTWNKKSEEADKMVEYSRSFNYDTYTEKYICLYRKLLADN